MLDGAAFFQQRTIRINRGPVLTLWAAVVAEATRCAVEEAK